MVRGVLRPSHRRHLRRLRGHPLHRSSRPAHPAPPQLHDGGENAANARRIPKGPHSPRHLSPPVLSGPNVLHRLHGHSKLKRRLRLALYDHHVHVHSPRESLGDRASRPTVQVSGAAVLSRQGLHWLFHRLSAGETENKR